MSLNCTVPVGLPPALDATLAVNVTACPYSAGLSEEVTLIATFGCVTLNVRSTDVAALFLLSPACIALTVTVPTPLIVTVLPLMLAGPETMLKLTGKFDEAVALTLKGASP